MILLLAILLMVLAAPFVREALRRDVRTLRGDAPGQLANLPQGTLHYRWFGPDDGPVTVCVHGLTTSSYVWDGMVPGLVEQGYRVLVFDHYGRGFSDRPRGLQDKAFFIAEIDALLADQGVEGPVTLIGYSMGGAVVTAYAAARPERVARAVLLASAGMQDVAKGLAGIVRRVPVLGDWLMYVFYPRILRKGIAAERSLPTSVPGIGDKQEAEIGVRGFMPSVLSSVRGLLGAPLEAEHRAIYSAGIPLQVIWGAQDDVIRLEGRDALTAWNPKAVQDVIEDGTHAIPYSHAEQIVELLKT